MSATYKIAESNLPYAPMSTDSLWDMTFKDSMAWALQRPTGEIMPTFIRRTKTEVLESVAEHFPHVDDFKKQWRLMRSKGFDVVRVEVCVVGNTKVQHRH